MNAPHTPSRYVEMIQVDGSYLYNVGAAIHPLTNISDKDTYLDLWIRLLIAGGELSNFIDNSVYQIRASRQSALELQSSIQAAIQKAQDDSQKNEKIDQWEAYQIKEQLQKFETVLVAEFRLTAMFLVTPKRGYDTATLIENGVRIFPDDLQIKVPEAVDDINQATRCIAFELPTASGFHSHRANESVLHRYYDVATGGAARPNNRNMGDYITAMERSGVDPTIIGALRSLKDFHRNPLIHPEHSLETVDDAIALLNAIHTAVVFMLKVIPKPST